MIPEIIFFVEGHPRPKQSFRAVRSGKRITGFTPARVKSWQQDVAWVALGRLRTLGIYKPLEGNLTVRLTFFLADARRQDSDNLSKAVLDALNKTVWGDDKQVSDLIITKYICRQRQGVLVRVEPNPRPIEISLEQMNGFGAFMLAGWTGVPS